MTTDVNVAPELSGNPAGNVQPSEDQMISQKQLATVLAREKEKAYERGRMEAEAKLAQPAQPMQHVQPQSIGGIPQPQISEDLLRKMIHEETPKALQAEVHRVQMGNLAASFANKMRAAEAKYPGLDAKLSELDYSTIHPLIAKVNDMDNAADIMKELVDNPMKMGNLTTLIYTQPKLASSALNELSNSIKQNVAAKEAHVDPKEPLGSVKPSANADLDSGKMTVADFRKMFST